MVVQESEKREHIAGMFNRIAGKYDLLNHLLSLNTDRYWRKKAVSYLGLSSPESILDLATGTGDFALAALGLNPGKIVGMDISEEMLFLARKKTAKMKIDGKIEFVLAGAEEIPFESESFTAVISAFGIRNFSDLKKGLCEAFRVLQTGGIILILEFSKPSPGFIRKIYHFYFRKVLPLVGGWISGDKQAYTYLPDSVSTFPERYELLKILEDIGFQQGEFKMLSGGIATMYKGFKRNLT